MSYCNISLAVATFVFIPVKMHRHSMETEITLFHQFSEDNTLNQIAFNMLMQN